MKTEITIKGGIYSISVIKNKLHEYETEKKTRFNGLILYYSTKEQAITDLKRAYRALKEDEPKYNGLEWYENTKALTYDTATAKVE